MTATRGVHDAPGWLVDLTREASIRSGLVVYGNTRDLFWAGRAAEYVTLPRLLTSRLDRYTTRAVWDAVDGLQFADESEARRWSDGVERAMSGGPAPAGDDYDLGEDDDLDDVSVAEPVLDLREVVAQYRLLLADRHERPLLIVDWSHLLVTQPAHPDAGERTWIVQLGKAIVGDATQRIDSDTLRQSRGLLVLVSASLGALPPALYQGEPRVLLASVPVPGARDRGQFFERHLDDVQLATARRASQSAADARRIAVEALTDASDQLTLADLRQVVQLSGVVESPLAPDRLLNLYRFGDERSPWEELSEDKLANVDDRLRERVVGQDAAVDHVATMIIRAWLGLAGLQHSARRSKPKGTLFFVGPTGVGKTELAKACAEFLFGDESACIRFDMSEFNHEHSDQRLVGAPPGYVGFEDGGQLTNAVRERPFSVLLFDEIEKAHGRVLDKFLQILEDGRLTDGRGETAWFSESVIIFTSNIGAADAPQGEASRAQYARHFRSAVEQHFVHK